MRISLLSFLAVSWAGGCLPGPVEDEPPAPPRTTFAFEPIEVTGLTKRWGAAAAPGLVFGGVDDSMTVQSDAYQLSAGPDGVQATAIGTLDVPRYCACGIFDEARRELLVLGGRDGAFADEATAVLLNVDTGERTAIDDAGAADHPVGCQAFFAPSVDRGYVFGGLASSGGFTADTWRWDPAARTMTRLPAVGPAARYDAGVIELVDGSALLVGGMGARLAAVFYSDVWRFDPASETWTEIPTTTDAPPGRRYPWVALAPDESALLYGFGSDSGRGESVLGDLWRFELATGAWSPLEVEGELPAARGFTYRLPGPEGTAGVLAFGSDEDLNIHTDAFALVVPDALSGEWR